MRFKVKKIKSKNKIHTNITLWQTIQKIKTKIYSRFETRKHSFTQGFNHDYVAQPRSTWCVDFNPKHTQKTYFWRCSTYGNFSSIEQFKLMKEFLRRNESNKSCLFCREQALCSWCLVVLSVKRKKSFPPYNQVPK